MVWLLDRGIPGTPEQLVGNTTRCDVCQVVRISMHASAIAEFRYQLITEAVRILHHSLNVTDYTTKATSGVFHAAHNS